MAPAERDQIAILRADGGGQEYVRRDSLGKEPAADGTKPASMPGTIKVGLRGEAKRLPHLQRMIGLR
jgi:hypothetical protein